METRLETDNARAKKQSTAEQYTKRRRELAVSALRIIVLRWIVCFVRSWIGGRTAVCTVQASLYVVGFKDSKNLAHETHKAADEK
eukprot:SAG31_NODE_3959_length_3718_cov_1.526389_3_plen_85_part_00